MADVELAEVAAAEGAFVVWVWGAAFDAAEACLVPGADAAPVCLVGDEVVAFGAAAGGGADGFVVLAVVGVACAEGFAAVLAGVFGGVVARGEAAAEATALADEHAYHRTRGWFMVRRREAPGQPGSQRQAPGPWGTWRRAAVRQSLVWKMVTVLSPLDATAR